SMENYMNCRDSPLIAKSLCGFVKASTQTIITRKLDAECTVKKMSCPEQGRTYCRLEINIAK
ncbi:MAG: hypothetical protein V3U20_05180, partial [Thermoplasmata archaeon]